MNPVRGERLAALISGVVLTAIALAGCTSPGGTGTAPNGPDGTQSDHSASMSASYPLTVQDCGEPLTLAAEPTSVLTIGTDALGLLDAAGALDKVTARSGEFGADLPSGLSTAPTETILDPSDPTTEKIIGSGVDTVIGYGLFNADAQALSDAGITVLTVGGECGHDDGNVGSVTFDTVYDDILRYGQIFGTTEQAQDAVTALTSRVEAVADAVSVPAGDAMALYHFSSTANLSSYGGGSFVNAMLDQLGMANVYGDQDRTYLEVSGEQILAADPEIIVLVYGLYGESREEAMELLLAEPGVEDMSAIRDDRVIAVLANQASASPDAVTGLESLAEQLAALV